MTPQDRPKILLMMSGDHGARNVSRYGRRINPSPRGRSALAVRRRWAPFTLPVGEGLLRAHALKRGDRAGSALVRPLPAE